MKIDTEGTYRQSIKNIYRAWDLKEIIKKYNKEFTSITIFLFFEIHGMVRTGIYN